MTDALFNEAREVSGGGSTPDGYSGGGEGVVAGRYLLVEPLGRGGAGTVWKATDLSTADVVALKLIAPGSCPQEEMRDRLRRETSKTKRLVGPPFVPIVDAGVLEGGMYVATPLLQGESLEARLERVTRLSLGELVELSMGIRNALSRAHALGIVHREIKPTNVFYASRGRGRASEEVVKVLDFGIPRDSAGNPRVTATGTTFLGTPHYRSPEQLRDGDVGARADLWATAVVLYRALTGLLPFGGPAPRAAIRIATSSFEPPSRVLGHPQPALDAFFARAFALQPQRRYASIDQLHRGFADAARGVTPEPEALRTSVADLGYRALAVAVTREAAREEARPSVVLETAHAERSTAAAIGERVRRVLAAVIALVTRLTAPPPTAEHSARRHMRTGLRFVTRG